MLKFVSRIVSFMPLSCVMGFSRFLGWIWYYIIPVRKKLALKNLHRALGTKLSKKEEKKIIRQFFSNFCMYIGELLCIPHMTLAENKKRVQIEGWEHMETALARGKGVILVATHIDNVDLGGCSMAMRGAPIAVVVRKMGKTADQFISEVRKNTGVIIISGKGTKESIKKLLAENKIVTIVIDQHLARYRSIVCKFFGQWASTTPAPARFALETGAAVIPAVIQRKKKAGHHLVRVSPPFEIETPFDDIDLNIRHNTERLNRIAEKWICETPNQWWWFHNRWRVHDKPEKWDIPESPDQNLQTKNEKIEN